jgi:hypothetical protein
MINGKDRVYPYANQILQSMKMAEISIFTTKFGVNLAVILVYTKLYYGGIWLIIDIAQHITEKIPSYQISRKSVEQYTRLSQAMDKRTYTCNLQMRSSFLYCVGNAKIYKIIVLEKQFFLCRWRD